MKEKLRKAGGSDLRMSRTRAQLSTDAALQYGFRAAVWLRPTQPPSTPSAPVGRTWVRLCGAKLACHDKAVEGRKGMLGLTPKGLQVATMSPPEGSGGRIQDAV